MKMKPVYRDKYRELWIAETAEETNSDIRDPQSPIYRNASQRVFRHLQELYPEITNYGQLDNIIP